MSQRAHLWIRVVALVVIAALSYLPRAGQPHESGQAAEVARK
jgi:hypothetical protein